MFGGHFSLFSNVLSFSNKTNDFVKWMRHEEDLPCTAPDECLLGRHLLLAIYPSTGTLKMFEIDKVAVVCAHTAFPLGFDTPVDTTGKKNKKNNTGHFTTLIGHMPTQSSLSVLAQIPLVNSELVTVIISSLAHAADVRGRERKKGNVQDASFLPLEKFLICSGFSLSPTSGAPMRFSTQGLQTRTLQGVLKWDTDTHMQTHTGCVVCGAGSVMACQGRRWNCALFFWASGLAPLAAVVHHRVW